MPYRGIATQTILLRGHNDDEIEAYVAKPDGDGPFPGVVVIHHMPGWDEWSLEVAWKLAHRGFAVAMPHLYSRYGPGQPDDVAARARAAGGMPDDQVVGDASGAARYLAQSYSNGKVGVIGFCSGGRQTYLVACRIQRHRRRGRLLGRRRHRRRREPDSTRTQPGRADHPDAQTSTARCSASSATTTKTRRRTRSTARRRSSSASARPTSSTATTAPATPSSPRTAIAIARSRPSTPGARYSPFFDATLRPPPGLAARRDS